MATRAPTMAPRRRTTARANARDTARAFTIIELLVVVGVISILVAFLMPVISRVREKARTVSCMNNEKGIYAACLLFAADNDNTLPCPATIGESGSDPDVARYCAWPCPPPDKGVTDFTVGGIWKYVGDSVQARRDLVNCPTDVAEFNASTGDNKSSANRNFSYSLNAYMRVMIGSHHSGIQLRSVASPDQKVMIFEEVGPNDGYCVDPDTNNDDRPSGRHGGQASTAYDTANYYQTGKGNFCFFDGHVELLSPNDIIQNKPKYYVVSTN